MTAKRKRKQSAPATPSPSFSQERIPLPRGPFVPAGKMPDALAVVLNALEAAPLTSAEYAAVVEGVLDVAEECGLGAEVRGRVAGLLAEYGA